jgi:hypothetical protein
MTTEQTDPKQKLQAQQAQIATWINQFKDYVQASNLKAYDETVIRNVEKVYWLGIITGIRASGGNEQELIPQEIQFLLYAGRSPMLDLKVKQVRVRKKKDKPANPHDIQDPGHDFGARTP